VHLKIDYIKLASPDVAASRAFFETTLGWTFQNYGPAYAAMTNSGIDGDVPSDPAEQTKAPLVILKADDLEAAMAELTAAGGEIVKPIFVFPGGRRFHFREPGGNNLGVWSA